MAQQFVFAATNNFYRAFREFYDALRAGRPAPEDAQAGYDVIDYCERTVENPTIVAESVRIEMAQEDVVAILGGAA